MIITQILQPTVVVSCCQAIINSLVVGTGSDTRWGVKALLDIYANRTVTYYFASRIVWMRVAYMLYIMGYVGGGIRRATHYSQGDSKSFKERHRRAGETWDILLIHFRKDL